MSQIDSSKTTTPITATPTTSPFPITSSLVNNKSTSTKVHVPSNNPHFLNDILQTTLAQLSENAMDSTWTLAIIEMVDHMLTFLVDDELVASQSTIEKILTVLKEHGWTGVDFYSAPDKKSLRKALSSFINVP